MVSIEKSKLPCLVSVIIIIIVIIKINFFKHDKYVKPEACGIVLKQYAIKKFINNNIYICVLFAGWEVRMVKNCDRGPEYAARGRRLRAAFLRSRSQSFTIRTDP